jgi:hypothetical protein
LWSNKKSELIGIGNPVIHVILVVDLRIQKVWKYRDSLGGFWVSERQDYMLELNRCAEVALSKHPGYIKPKIKLTS